MLSGLLDWIHTTGVGIGHLLSEFAEPPEEFSTTTEGVVKGTDVS